MDSVGKNPKMLVIADDLTGANDAGVQFAAAGIRSLVFAHERIGRLPDSHPVLVVNTESRHVAPQEAAKRVRRLAELGMQAGVACFYKKTDSTLRGNIAAELEALLEATQNAWLPFIPALPELGRTTKNGIHYVHGTPISQTAFARDPLNPVLHDRVADVLAQQTKLSIRSCARLDAAASGIVVLDCEGADDLENIAGRLAAANRLQVVSGSVALAKYLLKYLAIEPVPPPLPKPMPPILLVNGSVNERALEQIARAGADFAELHLTPEQLIGRNSSILIPRGGGNVLLHSISHRSELERYEHFGTAAGISRHDLHLRVAEQLGGIVRRILAAGVFQTLVAFGGDTLAGIARANHWDKFESLGEMEPGVSISLPVGSGLTLISKSGGFGDVEVVRRITRFVSRML